MMQIKREWSVAIPHTAITATAELLVYFARQSFTVVVTISITVTFVHTGVGSTDTVQW